MRSLAPICLSMFFALTGCATASRVRLAAPVVVYDEACTSSGERVAADARVTAIDETPTDQLLAEALIDLGEGPSALHLLEPANNADGIVVSAALGGGLGGLVAFGPLLVHGLGCLGPSICRGLDDGEIAALAAGISGGLVVSMVPLVILELAEDTVVDPERELGELVPCQP